MHRSGTSWLGAMLSARGELLNIQEPLNVNHGHTILTAKAARWYSYISATNEREYLPWYRDALDHRIHTDPEIARPRTGGWSSAPSPRCTTSSGCSYATTAATRFTKLLPLEAGSEACEVLRVGDGSLSFGEQQHGLPQSVRIRAVNGEPEPVAADKVAEQAEVVRNDGSTHRAGFHKDA